MKPLACRPPRRILVADDLRSSVMLSSEILRKRGYRVDEAVTASAALALLDDHAFDGILLNLHMPPNGGPSYVSEVKKRAGDAKLVVTTAKIGVHKRNLAIAGADAVLETPLDFRILLAILG